MLNINYYKEKVIRMEEAKFDTIFLADVSHIGRGMIPHYLSVFEGMTILSALSMVTKHIGLMATIATSYANPFTVACRLMSLDKISNGRAGYVEPVRSCSLQPDAFIKIRFISDEKRIPGSG